MIEQAQQAAPTTGRPLAEIDSFIDRMAEGTLKAILEENAELKAELGEVGPAVDINAVRVTLDALERRIMGLEALVEARFQNVTHLLMGITRQIEGAFPASSDST